MTTLKYFEVCNRSEMADEMIPLLSSQGLWYELRETSAAGWQLYIPILVNKSSSHFVNLKLAQPDWLGAVFTGPDPELQVTLKNAILILQEIQSFYARLETRVLAGDWRNSDTYETIPKDCTDADIIQFILSRC
jgi:hypothetical protein